MTTDSYRVVTSDQDAAVRSLHTEIVGPAWPAFMFHDPVAQGLNDCYEKLPQFQFALFDRSDKAVAIGNSIPLRWDGAVEDLPDEGWDWALTQGLEDFRGGVSPNILCALQIVVPDQFKGLRISGEAVRGMKANGAAHGLKGMIAPVRPNRKSSYPLTPIDRYIGWKTDDGLPFDPWMRVHARQGARIVKPCHQAMKITGTIAEWEKWTGLRLLESGRFVIPGALVPVEVDIEADKATYVEPNVWMYHPEC